MRSNFSSIDCLFDSYLMENKLLSVEDKQIIISKIQTIIPNLECPICHNRHFIIADGYFNSAIQGNLNGMILGGPSIPSIGLICNRCGFISHHALGVLGLMPPMQTTNDNKREGLENS